MDDGTRRFAIQTSLENHASQIEQLMEIGNTPGVSIAVLCNNEVILERGYGLADLNAGTKASSSTLYAIASVTKTFTAAACGILVSQGKLKWDDPIILHLQELHIPEHLEIERNATLIDTLSHRTGLQELSSLFEGPNGVPLFKDPTAICSALSLMPAESDSFRQTWSYCPPLYALVTLVIERVSGMPLPEFFETQIFQPLEMLSTSIVGARSVASCPNLAKGYTRTSTGVWLERKDTSRGYQFPYDASMGVQASVADMAKWAQRVIQDFNTSGESSLYNKDQQHILPSQADTIFREWCKLPPNEGGSPSYCLGWFRQRGYFIFDDMFDGDGQADSLEWPCTLPIPQKWQQPQTILYHSGLGHGFSSSMHVFPERGDAVIVLGNSSHAGDAVDCIPRLITSIICGYDLSLPKLKTNLQYYTNLEVGRWKHIYEDLRKEQENVPKRKAIPEASDIVGTYIHLDSTLAFEIRAEKCDGSALEQTLGQPVNAKIRFGKETQLSLDLWSFSDDTLSFLPCEVDYQRFCMSYLDDWSQFLIHLSFQGETSRLSGLWWQFDSSRDAIWFQRSEF